MLSFTLILLVCVPALIQSSADWTYASRKEWARKSRYCAGHLQSPIDLRFNVSQYDRRLKQLSLEERQPAEPAKLINNGHSAQLNLKGRYVLKNVAPESDDYNVEQLHFHWGQQDDYVNGSEHLHEGKPYPLEMHIVTYSSAFSTIHDAARNIRSLAVIGTFFEISEEDNPALKPLIDGLNNVRIQGADPVSIEHFDLKGLIGNERLDRYYRYDGSLTTPPCFESVIWSVALEPLKISRQQLYAFQILQDRNGQAIKNTYRSVKQLGLRKLLRSFHSEDLAEDRQQRTALAQNDARVSKMDMKLAVALASALLLVVV